MSTSDSEPVAANAKLIEQVRPLAEAIVDALGSPPAAPAMVCVRRDDALDIMASGIATIISSLHGQS